MSKLRRYLSIPLGIGLAFGIGLAIAQTYTRAIQLSQDTTGAFLTDTNNGVYFPGHILNTSQNNPLPTVTSNVGTPSVSTASTDVAGTITAGTSSTGIDLVFGRAYVTAPNCVVTWAGGSNSPVSYTIGTTAIHIAQGVASANKINYFCTSPS